MSAAVSTDNWVEIIPSYPGNKMVTIQNPSSNSEDIWIRPQHTTEYYVVSPGGSIAIEQDIVVNGLDIKNASAVGDQTIHCVYVSKVTVC